MTAGLFLLSAWLFFTAPMHLVEDSRYSLLVSRAVLDHGTVDLSVYHLPRYRPAPQFGIKPNGYPYQLYPKGSRLYLYYPLGTPLLSIPAVWVAGYLSVSPLAADGSYDNVAESAIEAAMAALLCAAVIAMFFRMALLWLPLRHSLGLAIAGGLCTPILSSLSRSLWSQTWLVTLLTASLYMICRAIRRSDKPNITLLASCVALMYFVRPTAALPILVISGLVFFYWRERFLPYALTGAAWAVTFVLLSKASYGSWLPPYYQQHLGSNSTFSEALAGNMVSPARGWLIYTPCSLLLYFLPLRAKLIEEKVLLIACIGVMLLHWLLIASWPLWWGGYSYGARLMSDTVPWLFLSMVLTCSTYQKHALPPRTVRLTYAPIFLVCAFCLFVNAGGAYGLSSVSWNRTPSSIDDHPERVWDWQHPQFEAGPYLSPEWPWPKPHHHSVE